ncbi:hypothetical protein [Fimbriiglobus ruber]|uniref:Serine/threonine protein kinase n=1 Tax=Fimbriiglobus ruber TaxID=1908690 RepID=A0A225DLG4_9BACT|nr:hypothetical protein [Fimbriiglobus ruber]OWK40464.1 Serine/threonine protein kinase [Fimbriiglobus ruber]
MSWPTPAEINEAVQNPQFSLRDPDLSAGRPETDSQGVPLARSGSNADVYCFTCGTEKAAVKCFTRPIAHLEPRYQAVHDVLSELQLPFTVDFAYQSQGIWLNDEWYPLVRMQWVDGIRLNEFARSMTARPDVLQNLIQILAKMGDRLDASSVGHCDLQHGNILLIPNNDGRKLSVRLVDYDGMWVPALDKDPPQEFGHPDYQHPERVTSGYYGPAADRFSLLAIATGLRGMVVYGDEIWKRYDNSVNVLFQQKDFADPGRSPLIEELSRSKDETLRRLCGALADASRGRLEDVRLLSDVLTPTTFSVPVPEPKPDPVAVARVPVPDEEDINVEAVNGATVGHASPTPVTTTPVAPSGTPVVVPNVVGYGYPLPAATPVNLNGYPLPAATPVNLNGSPVPVHYPGEFVRPTSTATPVAPDTTQVLASPAKEFDAQWSDAGAPDVSDHEVRRKGRGKKPEGSSLLWLWAGMAAVVPLFGGLALWAAGVFQTRGPAAPISKVMPPVPVEHKSPWQAARATHAKEVKAAETKMTQSFDKETRTLAGSVLETVKVERKRFNEKGLVPWSQLMRPHTQDYLFEINAADAKLKAAFDALADKANSKDEPSAGNMRAELNSTSTVKIVARWRHRAGNGPFGVSSFYSNGKINTEDGESTWALSPGGKLVLKWPKPEGGLFVDTCDVTANGMNYTGLNQMNVRIFGAYVD